ncbi:hypothetical protein HDU96_007203 [Phlyctochytrium bullatum]|nr:hypothetical protein HDU96_007203 [Phlyctochytrium bullatum]
MLNAIALDLNATVSSSVPPPSTTIPASSSSFSTSNDPFFALASAGGTGSASTSAPSPRRSISASSITMSSSAPTSPAVAAGSELPSVSTPSKRSSIYGAVVDLMSRATTTPTTPPPSTTGVDGPALPISPLSPTPQEAASSSNNGFSISTTGVRRWRSPSNPATGSLGSNPSTPTAPHASSGLASPVSPSITSFFLSSYRSLGFGGGSGGPATPPPLSANPLPLHRRPDAFLLLVEKVKGFLISAGSRDWVRCIACRDRFEERFREFREQVRAWAEEIACNSYNVEEWAEQDRTDLEEDRNDLEARLRAMLASVQGRRSPDQSENEQGNGRPRSNTSASSGSVAFSSASTDDEPPASVLPTLGIDPAAYFDAEICLEAWIARREREEEMRTMTDAAFSGADGMNEENAGQDGMADSVSSATDLSEAVTPRASSASTPTAARRMSPISVNVSGNLSPSQQTSERFHLQWDVERQWAEMVLESLRRETRLRAVEAEGLDEAVKKINLYDLDEDGDGLPLAQAGFGESRRAVLGSLPPVPVVVKRLRNPVKSQKLREILAKELSQWSKIDNAHVMKLAGTSFSSDFPSIITPYFKNGDLLTYTRSHPGHSLRLLHETALGMSYLHSLGIVHGSLRASNVLVSDRGAGVVTDFGLWDLRMDAAFGSGFGLGSSGTGFGGYGSSNKPLNHVRAGWKRWMAPEVLRGGTPRFPADVYAFSMTCYELVSGGPPFQGFITDAGYDDFVADNEEEEEIERRVLYDMARPLRPVPPSGSSASSSSQSQSSTNPHLSSASTGPQAPVGGCPDLLWDLLTSCWRQEPLERPEFSTIESRLKALLRMQSAFRRQSQIRSRTEAFVIHVPLDDLTPPSLLAGGNGGAGTPATGGRARNLSSSTGSVGSSRSSSAASSTLARGGEERGGFGASIPPPGANAEDADGLSRKRTISSISECVDSAFEDRSPRTSMISLNLSLSLDGVIGPPHPSTTLKFGIDLPPKQELDETSVDELSVETSEADEPSRDPASWALWTLLLPEEERQKGFEARASLPWPEFSAALRARLPTLLASPSLKRIVDPSNTHRVTHRAVSALLSTAVQPSASAEGEQQITLLDTAFARFCMTPSPLADPSSPVVDIQKLREVLVGRDPTAASAPDAATTLLHLAAKMSPGSADDVLDLLLDPRVRPAAAESICKGDGKGWTPLHHAAKAAASRAVTAIAAAGGPAALVCVCKDGPLPAKDGKHSPCGVCPVSRLITCGADVGAATPRTLWTPLHVSAWAGALGAVKRLLAEHADPWAKDGEGWTALVHATKYNHPSVVRVLLDAMIVESGGDGKDLEDEKKRARGIAAAQGFTEVEELLGSD